MTRSTGMAAGQSAHLRARRVALWLMAGVVLACYAVPYLLLHEVTAWYGSFLFWCLAGLVVIFLNLVAMAPFRDNESPNERQGE
ncbi:hypothetical protein [Halodurantibacterium flavum]|uniref:DUF3311 domain-containing protein n=1 Tax=Halodurantibacterium flavum TaxID=1382802 RepID=A0ABW4RZT5_9RHOB